MNELLSWMETSALGQLMRDSVWLFPAAEILHFVGLSLLIGSVLVVDLRLLGVIRMVSYQAVYKFLPLSLIGFGINLFTGVLFCFTDPFRYYPNLAFRIKLVLILLAGLNALWFKLAVFAKSVDLSAEDSVGLAAKIIALFSVLIWFSVIVLGRLIPYLEDGFY
jgi:hypothetical protein